MYVYECKVAKQYHAGYLGSTQHGHVTFLPGGWLTNTIVYDAITTIIIIAKHGITQYMMLPCSKAFPLYSLQKWRIGRLEGLGTRALIIIL